MRQTGREVGILPALWLGQRKKFLSKMMRIEKSPYRRTKVVLH